MRSWYWFSLATMVCWGAWGIFGKLASAQIQRDEFRDQIDGTEGVGRNGGCEELTYQGVCGTRAPRWRTWVSDLSFWA
jgi:hypothetical protein